MPQQLKRRLLPALLVGGFVQSQTPSEDEREIYRKFVRWVSALEDPENDASARYRAKLAGEGISAAEIDRHMKVINDVSPANLPWHVDVGWEENARTPGNAKFRVTPSTWLVECVGDVKPGKALDLGMAQGRNSLYLAKQGWDVTGIDLSAVAISHARAEAQTAGVKYNSVVANVDEWDMGRRKWDLIVAIFEPAVRWADRISDALADNALFVWESGVYGRNAVGENVLLKAFLGLRILRYEDGLTNSDYDPVGVRQKRRVRLQRLLAQKIA